MNQLLLLLFLGISIVLNFVFLKRDYYDKHDAQPAPNNNDGILKNLVIVMTLKQRTNSWNSFEVLMLSKLLCKEFRRSVYWNEYKKSNNKNTTNDFRFFLKSILVGVNKLFVLIYSNQDDNVKSFKTRKHNQNYS